MSSEKTPNRYSQLLEAIFFKHYLPGLNEITFDRAEINQIADDLGIKPPKNLGDVLYSFRYRTPLPQSIQEVAPENHEWIIRPAGRSKYIFVLVSHSIIIPSALMVETKILDATPGVISKYSMNDEQSLLAKIRYNRLIDIFTGLTCYSLQNHLRTTLKDGSQIETDEIYIGIDKRGVHYILPIQAKGRKDKIGIVQIEQDFVMTGEKFPSLLCRSIAAQLMENDLIAMFEFEETENGIKVSAEKHYRLVNTEDLSLEELAAYRLRQN